MDGVVLSLVMRLVGMIAKSDLIGLVVTLIGEVNKTDIFAAERAALCRQINPTLLTVIETIVGDIDGSDLPGTQKKAAVFERIDASMPSIQSMAKDAGTVLINKAVEFAVSKLRVES